jgi:hypothetical protein
VRDRSDGHNVSAWHWAFKDSSAQVVADLCSAVQRPGVLPLTGPLSAARLTEAQAMGEASVSNRKGRSFLVFELRLQLKWEGMLLDAEGRASEAGCGAIVLPDISPETVRGGHARAPTLITWDSPSRRLVVGPAAHSPIPIQTASRSHVWQLDDLEAEFSSAARGSALSEAMRTKGVRCLKCAVVACMRSLMAEVAGLAGDGREAVGSGGPCAAAPAPSGAAATLELDHVPRVLAMGLRKMVSHPTLVSALRFGCCGLTDEHVRPLAAALAFSSCELQVSDGCRPLAAAHPLLPLS